MITHTHPQIDTLKDTIQIHYHISEFVVLVTLYSKKDLVSVPDLVIANQSEVYNPYTCVLAQIQSVIIGSGCVDYPSLPN